MGWHRKYWDLVEQFYWTPSMLGLASLPKSAWGDDPDKIVIDRSLVRKGAALYTRPASATANLTRMRGLEEPLNHIFDITFGIAASSVIERMFARPLGLSDDGPFLRVGREAKSRYPDLAGNSTQQDAFFVSDRSLIGVELKLGSKTWPGQVLKYLSLMVAEEKLTGRRDQVGLLFVTPDEGPDVTFACAGVDAEGRLPDGFAASVSAKDRNQFIDRMLAENGAHFDDLAARVIFGHVSWHHVMAEALTIAADAEGMVPPNETLSRLMSGFAQAVAEHAGTISPQ
jgi:hypothetical protein